MARTLKLERAPSGCLRQFWSGSRVKQVQAPRPQRNRQLLAALTEKLFVRYPLHYASKVALRGGSRPDHFAALSRVPALLADMLPVCQSSVSVRWIYAAVASMRTRESPCSE